MEQHKRMAKKKIYIAGPISTGDQLANVNAALRVWSDLHRAGFVPFCPHWSALQHLHNPELDHAAWLEYDFHWVDTCDAVLRMPGTSVGADIEAKRAESSGKPVFFYGDETSLREIIQIMKTRLEV